MRQAPWWGLKRTHMTQSHRLPCPYPVGKGKRAPGAGRRPHRAAGRHNRNCHRHRHRWYYPLRPYPSILTPPSKIFCTHPPTMRMVRAPLSLVSRLPGQPRRGVGKPRGPRRGRGRGERGRGRMVWFGEVFKRYFKVWHWLQSRAANWTTSLETEISGRLKCFFSMDRFLENDCSCCWFHVILRCVDWPFFLISMNNLVKARNRGGPSTRLATKSTLEDD